MNRFKRPPLYTAEQRVRRDNSAWTLVQGVLAPVQFLAFLISAVLVLRYLATGEGLAAAFRVGIRNGRYPVYVTRYPNGAIAKFEVELDERFQQAEPNKTEG